jgi:hypothetical protein
MLGFLCYCLLCQVIAVALVGSEVLYCTAYKKGILQFTMERHHCNVSFVHAFLLQWQTLTSTFCTHATLYYYCYHKLLHAINSMPAQTEMAAVMVANTAVHTLVLPTSVEAQALLTELDK